MPRMMRISILLGVMFLIFLVGRIFWTRSKTPPPKPTVEYVKVVMASVDIPAHTVITGAMVREEERLPKEVPAGAFSRADDVINRVAKVDIFSGTPIMQSDVTQPISQEGLGVLIPEGYVAVALPIDNEALYRMLRTGDHVRIIASFGGLLSQTIVEDATVLGVDTKVMNVELGVRGQPPEGAQQPQQAQQVQQPSPSRTLLLLVRPEEAEKIALVSGQTNVRIEFSLLSSRPPVPTPAPEQLQKPPTMASDIHPAVERIAARGAGISLEELDKVFGRGSQQAPPPVPKLPPIEPAQIVADVHGRLLSEFAPQIRTIREEQERVRQEVHMIRKAVSSAITDTQLKQLVVEVGERLKNIEKDIENLKAKPAEDVAPLQPEQKETVTIFLGAQSIRAPVGQPPEVPPRQ